MKKDLTRRSFLEKSSKIVAVTGLSGCGFLLKGCSTKKDLDIVIKGGRVYDGLGNDPLEADIGIKDGLIKKSGTYRAPEVSPLSKPRISLSVPASSMPTTTPM